uniref:Guanylate-binding protein/Atlastin C-terminal domain-containing protein n=1 Tax=Anas platyrhynchos TaxID=8839 RepID=A0A8B9SH13_ANAPL
MEQELKLPTASQEELGDAHQRCKGRALALFMARVFADKEQRYQCQLMSELQAAKEEFCRRNEAASEERCRAVLRELWRDVEQRLDRGEYAVPGGSRRFQEHLEELREEYHRRPGLGVKVSSMLVPDTRSAEAMRAMEARQEEQRRSREEHQRQLEEQLQRKQQAMLEDPLRVPQEQEALLQEGFKREAEALREQIRRLEEENEEMKKPSWHQWVLDGLSIAAEIFLPDLAQAALRKIQRK